MYLDSLQAVRAMTGDPRQAPSHTAFDTKLPALTAAAAGFARPRLLRSSIAVSHGQLCTAVSLAGVLMATLAHLRMQP